MEADDESGFSPSGKRYATAGQMMNTQQQQGVNHQQHKAKRKRTVSMSTDDLPLSALGVNQHRAAQQTSDGSLLHHQHPQHNSASTISDGSSPSMPGEHGYAPMPSPFGMGPPSTPSSTSQLSNSYGMSSIFGRSLDADALLSGVDSFNNSLDAAYWHKFITSDGDELERESQQVTAEAMNRSYMYTQQQQEGFIYGMLPPSPQSVPPHMLGSSSSSSSSFSSSSTSAGSPSLLLSPPASSSSSSSMSTSGHLPLLTPKPDLSSSSSAADIRLSSSGLTGSRSGDTPKGLLARINMLEQTIDGQLKSLKYLQSNLMEDLTNAAELVKVQQTQEEVSKHLAHSIGTLNQLNDTQILVAIDAHRLSNLLDKLDLHAQRLRIYQEELTHALSGQPYIATAALIITKQPFPCTIKQGKSIDEPVEITLLTGAKVEIQKMGPVKAEMLSDDTTPVPKKKNTEPPVQNGVQHMREEGVAIFRNLMFPHGSRVKTVNIRFSQELTINGRVVTIHSEPSKPFIVMTNHGQRSATEGKLLKKSRVFDRPSIPWPAFANSLQLHYLKETKQDPVKPLRILSFRDLEYIRHYKFGGKSTISSKEYDSFWEWFGSILYKIRNPQKHILPMWIKGLIYGLISREECDSLMQAQNALPGSFLIRFSDSCAGQFVVVYVTQSTTASGQPASEVKHYLLQSEVEKRGTLPDFLRSCDKLRYVLVRQCESDTGEITLKPVPKDTILESYYSKEHAANLPPGYDVSGL